MLCCVVLVCLCVFVFVCVVFLAPHPYREAKMYDIP